MARTAPCNWTPDFTGCTSGPCCPGSADFSEDLVGLVSDVAAQVLWALSGRRFGECEITVRPCRIRDCNSIPLSRMIYWDRDTPGSRLGVGFGFEPLLVDGRMFNVSCGCLKRCTCTGSEVSLPGPVYQVSEVTVDGDVVDADEYTVLDWNKLVAVGDRIWPFCQDFSKPLTDPDTFGVTYTIGEPVPSAGLLAAGIYACELARALTNDSACRLPQRVQNITRQGIDIALVDPFALAEAGLTGLPFVDSWLRSVNPGKLTERPYVWSPDLAKIRRDTSTP